MLTLAKQLTHPQMNGRLTDAGVLPRELRLNIQRILGKQQENQSVIYKSEEKLNPRKTCFTCPVEKRRKTSYK